MGGAQSPVAAAGGAATVIHVLHVLEATTGGTQRHLRELVLGLPAKAFRQDVAISCRRDSRVAEDIARFRAAGVGVHVVAMRRRPAPLADLAALIRLVRLIGRLRPDIVHGHSSKGGFLGRLAARVAGRAKTVYTPHAFAFQNTAAPVRSGLYRALERLAVRWTDRLLACSRHEAELARSLGFPAERIAVVPNGVEPAPHRAAKAYSGAPVVGFVGRLCRQKGPDVFLAAIPRVLARDPETRFRVVGDGPWRGWLERQVARQAWRDCVSFASGGSEQEVACERSNLDLLAMPSRWEGMPYTLLDALAEGVPVVVADVGGIREVVAAAGEQPCARLVPPQHPASLAAAVAGLLRAPEERAALAAAGRARAAAYSRAAMLEGTAAVYLTTERTELP